MNATYEARSPVERRLQQCVKCCTQLHPMRKARKLFVYVWRVARFSPQQPRDESGKVFHISFVCSESLLPVKFCKIHMTTIR